MCLCLVGLSDENAKRLLADPPLIWKLVAPDDPEEDDTLGYLLEYLQTLRDFLNRTVEGGLGVVIYLS
jgi:hypothetical protein